MHNHLTNNNVIREIENHTAFTNFGKLLLPRNNSSGYYDMQLRKVGSIIPYQSHVDPDTVVDAINRSIDGVNDGNTVERRVENLKNVGVDIEYHRYQGAGHGFGLGTGTDAEGWVDFAVQYWEEHQRSTTRKASLSFIGSSTYSDVNNNKSKEKHDANY